MHESSLARAGCQPTGFSPADTIRHWSAELGQPIEDLTAEDDIERVAMLLTGHKSRAIFDRYNIINEQELLEAGDQLVAYLEQHAQATPRGGRPHPTRTAAPRTVPPLRLVRRTTA